MTSRIGLFGGTFDPVHCAHISIAERFVAQLQLDNCIFMPANISPFKTESGTESQSMAIHRLNMLKLAVSDFEKFEVDDFEISSGGVSFTYNTVDYLKKKNNDSEIFLLIGSDQAQDFIRWKNWEYILGKVRLCIALRLGFYGSEEFKSIMKCLSIDGKQPLLLDIEGSDLSSSRIRDNIKMGNNIKGMLPSSVLEYIIQNHLYR